MTRIQKLVFGGLGILAVVLLIILFLFNKKNARKFNWSETYKYQSEEPYGTSIIRKILDDPDAGRELVLLKDSISVDPSINSTREGTYIFIGRYPFYHDSDIDTLFERVEKGNDAFLLVNDLPQALVEKFNKLLCNNTIELDPVSPDEKGPNKAFSWSGFETFASEKVEVELLEKELNSDSLVFEYRFKDKLKNYYWRYVSFNTICEGSYMGYESLGQLESAFTNFFRIPIGEGYLYIHTNPILFSNYNMITEAGFNNASGVFSYLNEGPVFWDEPSKERTFDRVNYDNRTFSESPLSYILSQKSLAWAWYLLLALCGLFLFFKAKRRQRIIPLLASNSNTSLEFIQTIGRLYFQQNDHRNLALQKLKLFQGFVRDRYGINLLRTEAGQEEGLAQKSGMSPEYINQLFKQLERVERVVHLSPEDLISFHADLEHFYKHCK